MCRANATAFLLRRPHTWHISRRFGRGLTFWFGGLACFLWWLRNVSWCRKPLPQTSQIFCTGPLDLRRRTLNMSSSAVTSATVWKLTLLLDSVRLSVPMLTLISAGTEATDTRSLAIVCSVSGVPESLIFTCGASKEQASLVLVAGDNKPTKWLSAQDSTVFWLATEPLKQTKHNNYAHTSKQPSKYWLGCLTRSSADGCWDSAKCMPMDAAEVQSSHFLIPLVFVQ